MTCNMPKRAVMSRPIKSMTIPLDQISSMDVQDRMVRNAAMVESVVPKANLLN